LQRIAEEAEKEKTGARGLMTVCERLLRNFKFELPGTTLAELEIDGELVDEPDQTLANLLEKAGPVGDSRVIGEIAAFRRKFEQEHGVRLTFENDAVACVGDIAEDRGQSVLRLCEDLFRDYQFGLKLIQRNTGRDTFAIPAEALADPDKYLSGLVVASYREEESKNSGAEENTDTEFELES